MSGSTMVHPRDLLASALACHALCACAEGPAPESPRRPDVILVVVDTLRADYADPRSRKAELPNLARFAEDAVLFPRAFAHAPMTLPSHASLFSSRAPTSSGVVVNDQGVALGLPLLAEWLRDHGWRNQAVVSLATLWPLGRNQGLDRGFEEFAPGASPPEGTSPIADAATVGREVTRALDALDSAGAGEPCFLFAHYAEPHEPYEVHGPHADPPSEAELLWNGAALATLRTSEWAERRFEVALAPGENRLEIRSAVPFKVRALEFRADGRELPATIASPGLLEETRELTAVVVAPGRSPDGSPAGRARLHLWLHDVPSVEQMPARYRGEAEAADRAFGELVATLRARGRYDDSLIVFTSDHGEALGERGLIGHVAHLHDELLHVPLLIKLPRGPAGERGRAALERAKLDLARLVDVAPTILDALGLPPLPGAEGESLFAPGDRVLVAATSAPEAPRTLLALRDLRTKLVFDVEAGSFTMYDLANDPGETVDVFPTTGSRKQPWQERLRVLASGLGRENGPVEAARRERLRALGY